MNEPQRRVLITTSTFPVSLSDPSPRFVLDLADALTRYADVTVLAPHAKGAARRERLGEVSVHRFRYFLPSGLQRLALGEGMRDNLRGSLLPWLQIPTYFASQIAATKRLIAEHAIDVINPHWLVPQGVTAAMALGRRTRTRLLLQVHAGDVYLLRRIVGGRRIARFVMNRTAAVFADGSHVRDTLDELLGYESHARLRPMGVDVERFAGDTSTETNYGFPDGYILFFGRMSEKKGAIFLVRAMREILAARPGVGLVMIGDGPERSGIERAVREQDLGHRVQLLGRRPHADIIRHLAGCRVAVVPSIMDRRGETEGMPTVVLEAMAAGALVVASAVDGIPDIVRHRENGWLAIEQNPSDLAAKILEALETPEADAVRARARDMAAMNAWERVAVEYRECIDRVLGRVNEGRS